MTTSLTASITPTAPFAFDLALEYLRTSPSAVVEVIEDGAYHRAVRLCGRPAVLRVGPTPPASLPDAERGESIDSGLGLSRRGKSLLPSPRRGGVGGGVRVQVLGDGLGGDQLAAGVALAERVFGTGADVSALERDVAGDPVFAAVAARFRGLRPVLIADPFETLVWAILGQQINVRFAAKLKRALVERFGERVSVELPPRSNDGLEGRREFLLFPAPEALAGLDHVRDLRPLQFSRQKSEYTILVARAIASGHLDLEALRTTPPDEALARLMALKGIGRWTAEYVLMRGVGHPDSIPAADGGLRRVIGREYGLGRLATEAEVRALASRWAGWRSYAAFYWWFTLQLEARGGG
jgi:DNA-3-methyladenine glycosylase II